MIQMKSDSRAEWRGGWPVALACMVGSGVLTAHALALSPLIKPITQTMSWSRSEVTFGLLICAIVAIPAAPLAGRYAERAGVERLVMFGLPLGLLAFGCLGIFSYSRPLWIVGWIFMAFAAAPLKSNIWLFWTAQKFDVARGTAFAVVTSGSAIAASLLPMASQFYIDRLGWRLTFPALAVTLAVISFPICFFGVRRSRELRQLRPIGGLLGTDAGAAPVPGLTLSEALRRRQFWQILLVAFLLAGGVLSIQILLLPMLQEKHLEVHIVEYTMGAFGVSALAGRFIVGFLLDRYSARLIGALSLAPPALACLLYLTVPIDPTMAIAITILMGFGSGAEGDVVGYVATRCFGMRSFGTIFGFMGAAMSLGGGSGPFILSLIRDHSASYAPDVQIVLAVTIVSAALIATLGRFPDFAVPSEKAQEGSPSQQQATGLERAGVLPL